MPSINYLLLLILAISTSNCSKEEPISINTTRDFKMGFTTWIYAPTFEARDATYSFIEQNADIYAEHIDSQIPWDAWMNELPLPAAFVNEIEGRVNKQIKDKKLLLSVSLFNSNRDELANDFDGSIPSYTKLDDPEIEDAYFKHIDYLVTQFDPSYLVIAIEVNEFRLRTADKWEAYQSLMSKVKSRIKNEYPSLRISESISLHNLYEPDITNPSVYINEMFDYMNQMDFVAISFYPFFKGLKTASEFQTAFDFLHSRINQPIAFVETSHLAEDLIVPNFNLNIAGTEEGQNEYLETLLENAQKEQYEFIIWWTHRDFDALWETFPEELKDLGQLWRNTGLLDENGKERLSMNTWGNYFNQ